ncbi:MAG: hypothetical protein H6606_06925 [Flavobacteriales bacterium]|nr:hypothetical protein [Flavobacteriales bacterium]
MSEEKSINLRELTHKVRYYWLELWKKKWWVVLISAVVSGLFVLDAWRTPKTYPAKLTFMVNDDESGGMSGVGAILGELGFAARKGGHNYEKIAEIALSRKILSTVLYEKIEFKGRTDFVGNHLIDYYRYNEEWENDTILSGFRFRDSLPSEARAIRQRDVALEKLARILRGRPDLGKPGIYKVDYDEESTILYLICATGNEALSIPMANAHYEKLSDFYIQQSIERQRRTYEHVKQKSDSIKRVIENTEQQLARFTDQGHGIILNTQTLPRIQLQRKLEMLYALFGESVKNVETADFLLKNSTPYFQVIDTPVGPIQPQGKSRFKALIKGGLLGSVLGLLIILGNRWYRDEMAKAP